MIYILALLISICLILGQSLWGSAVKKISPVGRNVPFIEVLSGVLASPKFWLGAFFYGTGTLIYLLLLSKVKFFSVQISMTGLAIIFSVLISHFIFKESITVVNFIGIVLVLSGILLVMRH